MSKWFFGVAFVLLGIATILDAKTGQHAVAGACFMLAGVAWVL